MNLPQRIAYGYADKMIEKIYQRRYGNYVDRSGTVSQIDWNLCGPCAKLFPKSEWSRHKKTKRHGRAEDRFSNGERRIPEMILKKAKCCGILQTFKNMFRKERKAQPISRPKTIRRVASSPMPENP